jgi:antitoxin ParD1/3/4
MTESLPPELVQFLRQELDSGRYESETAVLCAGLRLLQEREDRLRALRREITPALEQLDRGEGKPLDAEAIKARGRRRLAAETEQD